MQIATRNASAIWRIGPAWLVATPGELFGELAIESRPATPRPGHSRNQHQWLDRDWPTRAAFAEGKYEVAGAVAMGHQPGDGINLIARTRRFGGNSEGVMKTVVLIGDSIRLGYQATVQHALTDFAAVGARRKMAGIPSMSSCISTRGSQPSAPAIIHINAGLHDLKTIYYGGTENIVPIDHYRATWRRFCARFRNAPVRVSSGPRRHRRMRAATPPTRSGKILTGRTPT